MPTQRQRLREWRLHSIGTMRARGERMGRSNEERRQRQPLGRFYRKTLADPLQSYRALHGRAHRCAMCLEHCRRN
jgi:hypothetical protein